MQNKTFRLFISSTFNDFRREREILQTKVFPHIKEYTSKAGYTFQPIDLRWGVSNEAQLDQKTLELCLNEVRACKTNIHPNFLIMIGDRYGWVPLPYVIEQKEFNTLKTLLTHGEKETLKEWYKLDLNQLQASYILKERTKEYIDYDTWGKVEKKLRTILQKTVTKSSLTEVQKKKYFLSATDAEVQEGVIPYDRPTDFQNKLIEERKDDALASVDHKHIFGFFRDVDKTTQVENKFIEDDYNKAQVFKKKVEAELEEENILDVNTTQIDKETLEETYLQEFETRMIKFLENQVDAQEKDESITPLQIEQEAQKYYAVQKRKNFIGQEDILDSIDSYIGSNEKEPLIIYAPSGRGKSSIMAEAIKRNSETKTIYRFVGATPNSSSSMEILTSIFDELDIDIRDEREKENTDQLSLSSDEEKESFEDFSSRVHSFIMNIKEDVTIFIDAIDQIQNDDQFLWLPRILPDNVKIIISALNDKNYKEDTKYFETLQSKTTNTLEVKEFSSSLALELLKALLKQESRTIQEKQKEYFLKQFSTSPSPLYVSIAAQEIKNWKSYDNTKDLQAGQKEIIKKFIKNLTSEYHHDEEFVNKVLSYIYASRDGLSESELLQLLEIDEEFVKLMADEKFHKNHTLEFPLVHWTRLHTQLKPFLSSKTQDNEELMYFSHREFEDAVKDQDNQRDEHEKVIYATQKLILRNQDKTFEETRWGKLYITLMTEYKLTYKDEKKQKEFAKFLANTEKLEENWIKQSIYMLNSIGYKHNEHNRMYKAMAYLESFLYTIKTLYKENPSKWEGLYTISLNNLASSYGKQNRLDKAIGLEEQSLELTKTLYKENPSKLEGLYAASLNNLASSYGKQNRLDEAIGLEEQSLDLTKTLYKENPARGAWFYTTSLNNLASSYVKQNRLDEAIGLEEQSLAILKTIYKENPAWAEPYTRSLNNLASSYGKQNRLDEAIGLEEQSLDLTKTLYKENPAKWAENYTISLNNLASSYGKQNRLDEAIGLAEQSLEILKIIYKENPARWAENYTISLNNLASSYEKQNRLDEAIGLAEQSLEILKSIYKENPARWAEPYTTSLNNLASSYGKQNRLDEAIVLLEQSLEIRKELYKENPAWAELYTTSLNNLAVSLFKFDKISESLNLFEKQYEVYKNMYGLKDSKTLSVLLNIEHIRKSQQKNKPLEQSREDATLLDLLLLSKFIALVNREDDISVNSFVNAFGFIEFNEKVKAILSQIANLDKIGKHSDSKQHIEQVKDIPKIPYSEELKKLVNQLKKIFGDEPIGTLR